jgi:uncharacterized membrane protein YdbT with pleckstrin-like domain
VTIGQRMLRFLRVPAAPSPPAGDNDVTVFRAAPNYFRYRIIRWVLTNLGAATGIFFSLRALTRLGEEGGGAITRLFWLLEMFAAAIFVFQAAARLVLLRIDIDQRWYLMSDRSLRIREGIITMNEKTMTFANIQNVRIEQGPVQRLFGIADVQVRTAGGGAGKAAPGKHGDEHTSSGHDMHIGYFRGVDNAEAIRDAIRERLRKHGDSGLGDPDDVTADADALTEAARALSLEAALLRKTAVLTRPLLSEQ